MVLRRIRRAPGRSREKVRAMNCGVCHGTRVLTVESMVRADGLLRTRDAQHIAAWCEECGSASWNGAPWTRPAILKIEVGRD